jgi:predicted TIM-barrel fold metal-dependent hydrolase
MHQALGIERGVLTQATPYGTDNRAMLDALQRGAPHLRGIVALLPEDLTEREVARLDGLGVRGVRLHHAGGSGPNLDHLEAVAERTAGAGWRIEIAASDIDAYIGVRPRIEKLKCPVTFDQMGKPSPSLGLGDPKFRELLAMFRAGLMWVKLSHVYRVTETGPPYGDVAPIAQALVEANPSRCIWGMDWPHPSNPWPIPNDGMLLDLLADWIPDEKIRNRVLVDNPAELNRF